MCQFDDVEQRNIPFAALDAANVVSVQTSEFGELLLGKSELQPQFADTIAKENSRVTPSHLIVRLTAVYWTVYTL
jgi:hypothetical protein